MNSSASALFSFFMAATLLAGCLGGAEPEPQQSSRESKLRAGGPKAGLPEEEFGARVQIYDKDGLTPLTPPAFPTALNMSTHSLARNCGEPTGGVTWKNDWVWEVCGNTIMRSKDHGVTWEVASTQVSSPITLDPYMWVDTITDRVYSVQLYVGCSWLSYTDDYGATWITNPVACGLPVNDHQTMAGGPPAAPAVSNPVYRNHLYYCVNQLVNTMCSTSIDGGITWVGKPAQVTVLDQEAGRQCSAINGHVWVAKDGTAYLPKRTCNRPSVMVSTTNGAIWEEKIVSRAHPVVQSLAHDPTVTSDTAGNAYYLWTGDDGILRLSSSKDRGATWSSAYRVSPPGMTMSLFETSQAGDPGRVAVAYFGTNQPRASPDPKLNWRYASQAPDVTVWNLYLTIIEGALSDAPLITTVQVNPVDDPIQRGRIWLQGGGDPGRNLLDFFDLTMGKDGRLYIHHQDGCMAECVTWKGEGAFPRSRTGHVSIVQAGPSLFEASGWLAPFDAVPAKA